MNEPTLPGMPDPPPERVRPAPRANVRISRTNQRQLCQACCADIHIFGVSVAPYPRTARWRAATDEYTGLFCDHHLDMWRDQWT